MLVPKSNGDVPDGYRSVDGGLLVPDVVARKRVIWTRADVKHIDRTTRFLKKHLPEEGPPVLFQFACERCGPRKGMALVRDEKTGQKMLRCGCTDRVLSGAI